MGFIEAGRGCAPDKETVPSPRAKEVIVYRDLFSAGLRFPLDAVVVRIHRNFDMYLHHLTPNAVLQLSVYMWALKTMGVSPSVENFVRAHTIHHQPLHMERMQGSTVVKEEAQFASLNFKYHSDVEAPVVCYKNKWDKYWNAYWFYYTVDDENSPLTCMDLRDLPKGIGTRPEDTDTSRIFLVAFCELARVYGTRDLVEEYCGSKAVAKRRKEAEERVSHKCARPAPVSSSEAGSSITGDPEENKSTEGGGESAHCEDAPGSGTAERSEEPIDVTSTSPLRGSSMEATLAKPFAVEYNDFEAESDEEPAAPKVTAKAKSPEAPATLTTLVAAALATSSPRREAADFVQAGHEDRLSSSSETDSDRPSGGVFVSMEQPSVVAKRLGLPTMTRLFGDRKRKMLQFSSDDRERELLKEAEDSFCFPIMEEELTNESVDEILTHAQDLSMKSFIACRAAQRRCRRDLRSHQLAEQTTASALEKEIAVVKQLQDQKEVLARSIAREEEKNSLAKQLDEAKTEMENLWGLAASAENEKKRTEELAKELEELKDVHAKLVTENLEYCDEIEMHIYPICQKVHDLLLDFGATPAPYSVKDMFISQLFEWLSTSVSSLASAGRSFGELGDVVSVRSFAHALCAMISSSSGSPDPVITKSDLRRLRDPSFSWPSETAMEKIPVMAKNIAKSFMQGFYKKCGFSLAVAEGRRVLRQVLIALKMFYHYYYSSFHATSYFLRSAFLFLSL
ncbi:hypothetical protein GQ55_3G253900 [Panicum hallii var. hallii]|uniref:Transposase (putative) gypsy type domain-containing protein n=1 Tax=Panicum hallii var. hallii TaxID=1504633 RepID=A0A2T7EDA3_9POAL|nr:hypothetical protein GQ55_3G253900 [Panicum hallii var. hallii]